MNKCFDNIYELITTSNEDITHFKSAEGEIIDLKSAIRPQQGVENWLSKLEVEMKKKV